MEAIKLCRLDTPIIFSDKTLQVGYANHFYRSAHKFEQICRHRLRRQNVGYSNFSQPQSHLSFCVLLQYLVERKKRDEIEAGKNYCSRRFVVTGCAAKTSATVTFPSLNLISLFAFCFNIWLNAKREMRLRLGKVTVADDLSSQVAPPKRRLQ